MFAALGGEEIPRIPAAGRTFATQAARKATTVGGSLRGVQDLLGRASLTTTQRYPEPSSEGEEKAVVRRAKHPEDLPKLRAPGLNEGLVRSVWKCLACLQCAICQRGFSEAQERARQKGGSMNGKRQGT